MFSRVLILAAFVVATLTALLVLIGSAHYSVNDGVGLLALVLALYLGSLLVP